MTGKIDKNGAISLSWNLQESKLYSPDGLKHLLPCEHCGQPQWAGLTANSIVCDACALAGQKWESFLDSF
jgi:hypothetical protein